MKDTPHPVAFHSSIPPEKHDALIEETRRKLGVYIEHGPPVTPEKVAEYTAVFESARAQVSEHLISLGIPQADIERNLAAIRLVIGGLTTHYNPTLHTLVLRPDEIETIVGTDTPENRARVVRHEVAHAISRTTHYHTHENGGITHSGISTGGMTRAGIVEYGFALNEIVIDTIAVRSGTESVESPRAQFFSEITSYIMSHSELPIAEAELYRLFAHVACRGWSARPEGKTLKRIIRSVYGDDGMSVLMRLKLPTSETEAELETQLRSDPLFQFMTNAPSTAEARAARARELLKKNHG
ncbi:MAG: hypothetical protein RI911_840 [Candidatus Parcubacteria bacterium]|jgi:hypothetical protein